jgi:hypothetical protein
MADFKASLARGLERAKRAREALAEIQEVFHDLAAEIFEATGKQVEMGIEKRVGEVESMAWSDTLSGHVGQAIEYEAVVAKANGRQDVLARIEFHDAGYPVLISYAKVEASCGDRTSLEVALSEFLEHPRIGKAIQELMSPIPGKDPKKHAG